MRNELLDNIVGMIFGALLIFSPWIALSTMDEDTSLQEQITQEYDKQHNVKQLLKPYISNYRIRCIADCMDTGKIHNQCFDECAPKKGR